MKFPFHCNYERCGVLNPLDYIEQNLYRYKCVVCGRKNAHAMSRERFEVLFDFGTLALLDGYYREAVADFATALERFFEFFVRTVFREQGLPDETVEETWKLMSRQSERQLGAFTALYLLITHRSPDFLSSERLQASFRNSVVHRGRMPSREETAGYAETVHALIRRLLGELWKIAPYSVGRIRDDLTTELGKQAEVEGYRFSVYAYDGMFGVLRFSPTAVAITQESCRLYTESDGSELANADWEHLRTDLRFEDALKARRMLLEAAFYDKGRHGPEGSRLGEGIEDE